MYYVDYCGISELGRRLAAVSKGGQKTCEYYAILSERRNNIRASNYRQAG